MDFCGFARMKTSFQILLLVGPLSAATNQNQLQLRHIRNLSCPKTWYGKTPFEHSSLCHHLNIRAVYVQNY